MSDIRAGFGQEVLDPIAEGIAHFGLGVSRALGIMPASGYTTTLVGGLTIWLALAVVMKLVGAVELLYRYVLHHYGRRTQARIRAQIQVQFEREARLAAALADERISPPETGPAQEGLR